MSEAIWMESRKELKVLAPGWEWFWMENPWKNKWERLLLPKKEAQTQRSERPPEKASYWGEKEAREWGRKIREEKAKLAWVNRERREREQATCIVPQENERHPPPSARRNPERNPYPFPMGGGWRTPDLAVSIIEANEARNQTH